MISICTFIRVAVYLSENAGIVKAKVGAGAWLKSVHFFNNHWVRLFIQSTCSHSQRVSFTRTDPVNP